MRTPRLPSPLLHLCVSILVAAGCAESGRDRAVVPQDEPTSSPARAGRVDLGEFGYAGFSDEEVDPDEGDGVVLHGDARSYPGYDLYTNIPFSEAILIDSAGAVVNRWHDPRGVNWERALLLEGGDLLVVGRAKVAPRDGEEQEEASYLARLTWESAEVWRIDTPAHHDVSLTPDGRILALTEEVRHPPGMHADARIRDNVVLLVSMDGAVEDRLSIYDCLASDPALELWARPEPEKDGRWALFPADLLHVNSVRSMDLPGLEGSPLHGPDKVVISSRHQDLVAVLDWKRRSVLWRWGRGEVHKQHEAVPLPNGNLMLLDNNPKRGWSRVLEVDPREDRIVWQYPSRPSGFFTPARGTAQPLPNGNVLIANSYAGEGLEVTRAGEVVWRFLNPHYAEGKGGRASMRIQRFELELVDAVLAARAGER